MLEGDPRRAGAVPPRTTAPVRAEPGRDVVADRFEVLTQLGAGGMGRVFAAFDRVLKRQVAIKDLSPQLAGSAPFSEQMLREARAVAQLNHTHIIAVHDVVSTDAGVYIVMELLHGETLAAALERGPLAPETALGYARQIVSALRHAHEKGILHCDLTPRNVFLTEAGVVKVMDFGLARVVGRSTRLSTAGIGASAALAAARPGTPGYMSPEQRQGVPLDVRTDIYSVGVILGEMLGGAALALSGTRRSSLAQIVARATAADPAQRFQTAADLDAALAGVAPGRSHKRPWLRVGLPAAMLVVVGAVLASSGLARSPRPLPGRPPVVGVAAFASDSTEPSMSYLAAGLSDLLTSELATTNAVVVTRAPSTAESGAAAEAMAQELGAAVLLLGHVSRGTGGLRVGLRMYSAAARTFSAESVITRSPQDLVGARRLLVRAAHDQLSAAGLLPEIGAVAGDGFERQLPRTMDVFEDFAQARWFLERFDVAANIDHALAMLTRITQREPQFALGFASLGEASWRKWQRSRDPAWSAAAQRHALEALRLSGGQPEVRYSVALIYQGTGRVAEATAELEAVVKARPLDDAARRLLGRLYADTGHLDQGVAAIQEAIALRPGYWANYAALGNVAYRAGNYPLAADMFRRFADLRPDSASAFQRLGTALHAAGDEQGALQSYERSLQLGPNANAYSNIGTIHFDARRYDAAIAAYTRAIAIDPRNPSLHRNLGDALRRAGRTQAAQAAYRRAVVLAGESLKVDPRDAVVLSVKAISQARTGALADAAADSTAALALAPSDSDILFEHALIALLRGQPDEAIAGLGRAAAAGYNVTRMKADPDLEPVTGSPAFRQVVAAARP